MKKDFYFELADKFKAGSSQTFLKILKFVVNGEKEARILLALPGSPREVAKKLGKEESEIARKLKDLHMRGFTILEGITPGGPRYSLMGLGHFMDSVLFDPKYDKYGDEFFELWKTFCNQELLPAQKEDSSFNFRVLPLEETIRKTKILPYESASQMVESARKIAVQRCPCRKRERRCDAPLEVCISLNELADYVLKRQLGRQITKDETLGLLKDCEKKWGLIHQTVNSDHPDVICNCCSCCCVVLRAVIYYRKKAAASKSRFRPQVDPSKCTECLKCTRVCYFSAMINKDGQRIYQEDNCYGCGLCASNCPNGAIELVEVLPPEHIPPGKGYGVGWKIPDEWSISKEVNSAED